VIAPSIGFIGAGNMAEALIRGLLETGVCSPQTLFASEVNPIRRAWFMQNYGLQVSADTQKLVASCSVLVLAVKPQQVPEVMAALAGRLDPQRHTLVSIAAGITTAYLEKAAGAPLKIIRVMPNTPAKLRAGATAFCLGRHAGETEKKLAEQIFEAVGKVVAVDERLLDAVTAVSGSGPAYVFLLCELMIAAGQDLGLSRGQAETLSVQTILGSARMLSESGQSAATLRTAVTSAGGTTEAALKHLAEAGFGDIFKTALAKARDRARELTPADPEPA
jgi:pyrroline-5-carboxylate reductase